MRARANEDTISVPYMFPLVNHESKLTWWPCFDTDWLQTLIKGQQASAAEELVEYTQSIVIILILQQDWRAWWISSTKYILIHKIHFSIFQNRSKWVIISWVKHLLTMFTVILHIKYKYENVE